MLTLRNRSSSCAFLCYHSIAPVGPRFLSISAELFERQLDWLRRSGWQTGDSATLDGLLAGGRPKTRTGFLTFDDGYRDTHDAALPLLKAYRAKAIVFVLPPALESGRLSWPEIEPHATRHPDMVRSMTWEMVEALSAAGIEIGSHGLSHRHLDRLAGDELREELLASRRAIASRVGACRTLAYPFGDWGLAVAAAAAETGYEFAFTMPSGGQWRASRWSIPRVPVDYRDDERRFALKLSVSGRLLFLSPLRIALRKRRRTPDD
jgi:peptidoglycan/xylan/chitin deacetylase (PgdA/CDA1 family)